MSSTQHIFVALELHINGHNLISIVICSDYIGDYVGDVSVSVNPVQHQKFKKTKHASADRATCYLVLSGRCQERNCIVEM